MEDVSEAVAPLYLLIKDQKGWKEDDNEPSPSRLVCSSNGGVNRHISEIISYVLEPLAHSLEGADIDSTGGMLEKIERSNEMFRKGDTEEILDIKKKINTYKERKEVGDFSLNLKEKRIKRLRDIKVKGTVIPKMKGKLWATRITDEKGNRKDGIS